MLDGIRNMLGISSTNNAPNNQSHNSVGTLGGQTVKPTPPEKKYSIGVHSTPGWNSPVDFTPQHHSLSFKKETLGSDGTPVETKQSYVGMGKKPGTEDGSRYNKSVQIPVSREQYKAVKQDATKEVNQKIALPPGPQMKDFFFGDGNCQDLARRNLEKHGVAYPEKAASEAGIRNESFRHQPPMTPEQKQRFEDSIFNSSI